MDLADKIESLENEIQFGNPKREVLIRESEAISLGLAFYAGSKDLPKEEKALRDARPARKVTKKPKNQQERVVYVTLCDYLDALKRNKTDSTNEIQSAGGENLFVEPDDRGHTEGEAESQH